MLWENLNKSYWQSSKRNSNWILCTYAFIEILKYHRVMKSWNVKVLWGRNISSNRFYWVLVRSEWQLVVGAVKLESPGRNHNGASSPIPAGHKLVGNVTGCSRIEQCRFQTCENRDMRPLLPSRSLVGNVIGCFQSSVVEPCRYQKTGSQHNGASSSFPRSSLVTTWLAHGILVLELLAIP